MVDNTFISTVFGIGIDFYSGGFLKSDTRIMLKVVLTFVRENF